MSIKNFLNLRVLCALRGVILLISFPSLATSIAFVAPVSNTWQVFTTDLDGSNTRQLTSLKTDARLPDWFPERTRIAFTTSQGTAYILELKSNSLIDTINMPGHYIWQASASNDCKFLYLVAGDPDEIDKTFIIHFDLKSRKFSHELRLYTPVYNLSVSAHTGDLLFANCLCGSVCNHVIQEIWLKNEADGSTRQLHIRDCMSANPCWFPDGKSFLFDSEVGSGRTLFRQNVNSRDPVLFFNKKISGNITQPTISPDGKYIVCVKDGNLYYCSLEKTEQIQKIVPFKDKPDTRIKDPAW